MAFLKVLNVQQGDCMTFRLNCFQTGKDELYYVDLGNGKFNVSKEIRATDNVHLILTHSHRDHIYGFCQMLPHINKIDEIILPYCFNEIWLIAKAILSLKGMRKAIGCEEAEKELIDIDLIRQIIKHSLGSQRLRITFAYDGMTPNDHIRFYNPPLPPISSDWIDDDEYQKVEAEVKELFVEEFAEEFLNYVNAQRKSSNKEHDSYGEFIPNSHEENNEVTLNMERAGCKMVLEFMSINYGLMSAFNNQSNRTNFNNIVKKYRMTAHDACLVTMLINGEKRYLLGGDASKKVFNRLIKTHSIQADYFKIPHHGSSKNLDNNILQHVDPKIAIISHGNGLFGGATDPHPNQKVLNLLSNRSIQILVTNDVIKKGVVVLKKRQFSTAALEIE